MIIQSKLGSNSHKHREPGDNFKALKVDLGSKIDTLRTDLNAEIQSLYSCIQVLESERSTKFDPWAMAVAVHEKMEYVEKKTYLLQKGMKAAVNVAIQECQRSLTAVLT